jgi:hypothetical protein
MTEAYGNGDTRIATAVARSLEMTTIDVPGIDASRAKVLARALQKRHQTLGTTVSLNHAYETLASFCGFDTWSRMKATLDTPQAQEDLDVQVTPPPVTGSHDEFLESSKIRWSDFVPNDLNPFLLLCGGRQGAMARVVSEWRASDDRHKRVRVISQSLDPQFEAELGRHSFGHSVRNVATGKTGNVLKVGTKNRSTLNIFDTMVGARRPTIFHRDRISNFLSAIICSKRTSIDNPYRGLCDVLAMMAYEAFGDEAASARPKSYHEGLHPDIDKALTDLSVSSSALTWWCVVDIFLARGLDDLARIAQTFAVPRLDDIFGLLNKADLDPPLAKFVASKGSELVNEAKIMISWAIREFPFLRGPTSDVIDFESPTLAIEIDTGVGDIHENFLLYHVAVNAVEQGMYYDTERALFAVDMADQLMARSNPYQIAPEIISRSYTNRHVVMRMGVQASTVPFASLAPDVSSAVILSCSSRLHVNVLQKALDLDDATYSAIHDHLFDYEHIERTGAAVGMRRGFKSTTQGLFRFPK